MKISVLTTAGGPLTGRLELEVETLLQQGHSVHVLHAQSDTAATAAKQSYRESFVGVKGASGWSLRTVTLPVVFARMLRELRQDRPDVIHCAHPVLLPLALAFARTHEARVVYDSFEFYALIWSEYLPLWKSRSRRIIEKLEDKCAAGADCVVTVDSREDALARRYRKVNPRVVVLYNVPKLATEVAPTLVESLRAKYAGLGLVTYVGGIHEDKGVHILIDAIELARKRTPAAKLLLIGHLFDPEPWRSVAQAKAESIEIIPWLAYDEMLALLQIAKVGLAPYPPSWHYPLLSRGNGRKFFSYMQAGLPIIGPEFGEIGQVVREEQCGLLVDTTDPKQVSEAIVRLLTRPKWAAELGARGRRAVLERYNWDLEQHKLLEAYASLTSAGAGDNGASGNSANCG